MCQQQRGLGSAELKIRSNRDLKDCGGHQKCTPLTDRRVHQKNLVGFGPETSVSGDRLSTRQQQSAQPLLASHCTRAAACDSSDWICTKKVVYTAQHPFPSVQVYDDGHRHVSSNLLGILEAERKRGRAMSLECEAIVFSQALLSY